MSVVDGYADYPSSNRLVAVNRIQQYTGWR